MSNQQSGQVLIISGPSGVGKDTIINIITSSSDFVKMATCTTRKPRDGEVDGVHYHFVNDASFALMRNEGKLLDHVVITDNHYGMPLEKLGQMLNDGRNIVLHLVVGSAFLLKRIVPEALLVFIMPSSQDVLAKWLRKRGMTENEITNRLRDDPTTLQASRFFDFIIVNHDNEEAETANRILRFIEQKHENKSLSLQKNSGYNRLLYMYPDFFATTNSNKLREVNEILDGNLKQIELELYEPQGLDVAEVVRQKAEDAFRRTGKIVLVEDTGLEFIALNGLPGALIKWFMGTIGNEGILKMLAEFKDRRAIAKTAVGFFDGNNAHVFIGEIKGTIPETIRGNGGFGWDPIFIPDGHSKSFAEMNPQEKNAISMRRLALESMKASVK